MSTVGLLLGLLSVACVGEVLSSGLPGAPGLPGLRGDTGSTGPAGTDGSTGATGDMGGTGPQGTPGVTGLGGNQGAIGPPGSPGPPGENGTDGTMGSDGVDGADGDQGDGGVQGEQGPAGPNGTPGPPGTNGKQGDTGFTGPAGEKGPAGEDGEDGTNGIDGPQGPPGSQGATGATGTDGAQGDLGRQGPQGATGPTGETGDPGTEPEVVDECAADTSLCDDSSGAATCVNLKYGYVCSCVHGDQYGFSWDDDTGACVRPDDGKTSACDFNKAGCSYSCVPGATFVDYTCRCADGFELSNNQHTCQDVDECLGAHGCVESCMNMYGGYECTCPDGYMLEGQSTCTNIDECEIDSGGCQQVCTDNDPGYECSCTDKFVIASDQVSCLNKNSMAVKMKLDKEFTADLSDETSAGHRSTCTGIATKIPECQVEFTCRCAFSNGSIVVVVELMSSSAAEMRVEEQEMLAWKVKYALLQNGTTLTLDGEAIAVLGPVLALFDVEQANESILLDDPCARYEEDGFCLEGSRCDVQYGEPGCICTPSFSGEQCNLPGPGYSTEDEFSELEIVQLTLLVLALLLSFLSLFLGSFAFSVYHQHSRAPASAGPRAYSDSELAPPYGKYFQQRGQQYPAPRPFEISLPDSKNQDVYRRYNRNY